MTSTSIVTLFYRRLLDLDPTEDPASQLAHALRLLVELTSASAAYLELFGDNKKPRFSLSTGLREEELAAVRVSLAEGVVAHTIAAGRIVELSCTARELPGELASKGVAITCVPIGRPESIGVLYLERLRKAFTPIEIDFAKLAANQIEPLCSVLVPRTLHERVAVYKRLLIRQELQRNGWNMTATARVLRVGRAALYRAMQRK